MSATSATPDSSARSTPSGGPGTRSVTVLLYSDNISVRDTVRAAVGRRPARDVEIAEWHECATAPAVTESVESGDFDLLVLDGEAAKVGGMGLCRELKSEIYDCPPVLVLTGRPQDGWLATWSLADAVVPHPLDAIALSEAVARLARGDAGDVLRPDAAADSGRTGPDAD